MDWTVYQTEALKTKIYPKDFIGIAYTALGLNDEVNEFCDAEDFKDKIKELGDVCWYVACFSYEVNIDLDDIVVLSEEISTQVAGKWNFLLLSRQMQYQAAKIGGLIKKYLRDEDFFTRRPSPTKKEKLKLYLAYILAEINYICSDMKIDLKDVMMANLDKLHSRQIRGKLQGSGDDR